MHGHMWQLEQWDGRIGVSPNMSGLVRRHLGRRVADILWLRRVGRPDPGCNCWGVWGLSMRALPAALPEELAQTQNAAQHGPAVLPGLPGLPGLSAAITPLNSFMRRNWL